MSERELRALVVEDDTGTRQLLKEILGSRGHQVEACADAETAWASYQRNPHALVLLDLRLPGMDGLDLCRKIRDVPDAEDTVIVFVTGAAKRTSLEAALEAGADDYIQKPVNDELLHVRLAIAERSVRESRARKEREADLVRDALHDPLTGLANRSLLKERVGHAARRSLRQKSFLFAVLMVDLDDFASVNARHGTKVGDRLIQGVGRRLEECVRSVDTVARIRKDEFAILLDDMNDVSDPSRVAGRIHQALASPFELAGETVFATACVGIALSATGYETAEEILRDAHKALGRAKEQGRSATQMYDPVMHARAMARVELESRIRQAMEDGQVVLHYQPIVELDSGGIVGFEALARWEDERRGIVAPEEFVPVAEETGLIVPLGWHLLDEAVAQLREWQPARRDGREFYISVNMSGKQFSQPDALDRIRDRLAMEQVMGHSLHLEITETSLMANVDIAGRMLARLKEHSIHVQVDDFGTGYSSLSYLCRFPIDTLKIDRSFIAHMLDSEENLEVVRTIVRLARNLGMQVVAEGVETEGQLDQLRKLRCDFAQGYLFSRPVERVRARELLEKGVLA